MIYIIPNQMLALKKRIHTFLLETQLERDTFKQWEEDNKLFILTKGSKEVERRIRNNNLVIVTGHSGSGKSAIIQHIALRHRSQGWIVKLLNGVEEISKSYQLVLQDKTMFVLNDPIGKRFLDEIAYSSWEKNEEWLNVCLNKVKLLMSCRKYILSDVRVRGIFKDKSKIVDINDAELKLTNDEKERLWNIHSRNKILSKEEYDEIFKTEEYFPLLCKLYFENRMHQRDGLFTFFGEPVKVVEEEIRSFRISCKEKYCALVLLVLLNNNLIVTDLRANNDSEKKFKLALQLCGMKENTSPYVIGDTLETLNGYFVKKIGDTYQFYHDFVMEVTTLVFGQDFPTNAIKYADISFLRKRVKTRRGDTQHDHFTIYLSDKHTEDLGERLFTDLLGEHFLDVVLNPCLKNEIMTTVLIRQLDIHPENLSLLLEKRELSAEKQELNQSGEFYVTKLSILKLQNKISPLCALIVYSHTQLSFHILKTLRQMQRAIKDDFLFSAVCCNGSLDLFNLFSKKQVKRNLAEKWEIVHPIHFASMFHNFEILQELIQFGVDVNLSTEGYYWTPLMLAAGNDTKDNNEYAEETISETKRNQTVQLLLNNGAIYNSYGKSRVSPLFLACRCGHTSTVKLLLCYGADFNLCAENGASPLLMACEGGHDKSVQILLSIGANVNLCTKNGVSPLLQASDNGYASIVKHLLSYGADVNLCAKNGVSPLYLACKNGHDLTVHLLLSNGADINACDENVVSPLVVACENGRKSTVQLLLSFNADVNVWVKNEFNPLQICSQFGYDSIIQLLLSNGANVNLCSTDGVTPLILASKFGHDSTIQVLLSNGAEINLCMANGISPVYAACQNGHDNTVQTLLKNGADINLCAINGGSPLFMASGLGHDTTVHLLLSNGADINLCDENGINPLYMACQNGHFSTVELLLSNGADINASEAKCSPLIISCLKKHFDIAEFLLNKGAAVDDSNVIYVLDPETDLPL